MDYLKMVIGHTDKESGNETSLPAWTAFDYLLYFPPGSGRIVYSLELVKE